MSLTLVPKTPHVVPVALTVRSDEKALAIVELNHLTTDYRELRRWQFIYVNRDDKIAEWCRDLGPSAMYPYCSEFRIYSFFSDEVAELMDQAEDMRNEALEFRARLMEHQATSNLIPEFLAFKDEQAKQRKNQSTFGPGFNRARNLFARKA